MISVTPHDHKIILCDIVNGVPCFAYELKTYFFKCLNIHTGEISNILAKQSKQSKLMHFIDELSSILAS